MLASFKYSYWHIFPMVLEQFNAKKMCLQSNIFVKISEESIFTLFCLEVNLGFGSSWIIGTNALWICRLYDPVVFGLLFCATLFGFSDFSCGKFLIILWYNTNRGINRGNQDSNLLKFGLCCSWSIIFQCL